MIKQLLIEEIRTDGGTQSRCDHDRDLVSEYSRAMYDGAVFPPMLVFFDGTHYWLADGFHRHAAYVDIGQAFVDVQVKEGSLRDAQLYSFSANANHGKRRTNADKRKAVLSMLADAEWCQWSNREIAKACQVSPNMVDQIRNKSSLPLSGSENLAERTYTTKHGTEAKMKTSKIGKKSNPVKDALDAGEITPDQAKELADKPEVVQQATIEKIKAEKAENEQGLAELEQKIGQEGVAAIEEAGLSQEELDNLLAEHEARLDQLAELVDADDKLAEAVARIKSMSEEILAKDRLIKDLEIRLASTNNTLNYFKSQNKSLVNKLRKLESQAV